MGVKTGTKRSIRGDEVGEENVTGITDETWFRGEKGRKLERAERTEEFTKMRTQ